MIRTQIVTKVRQELNDPSPGVVVADDALDRIIDDVLLEIADRQPLLKYNCLPIIEYTKNVSLSSIPYLNILRVEYPTGNYDYGAIWRDFKIFGTELELDLDDIPTITDGTLTGTITFTNNSRSVTGSGTTFTTELDGGDNGDLICLSSGSLWYKVVKVVSDTSLTLEQVYEGATATDTANSTLYRDCDSCVKVHWGSTYTVSTTTNMPITLDRVLILGSVAYAALNYVNLLSDTETQLDAVDTDLASAATYTNTVNVGGDVAGKYTEQAKAGIAAAAQRQAKAKEYKSWALAKYQEYKYLLNRTGRFSDSIKYPGTRGI